MSRESLQAYAAHLLIIYGRFWDGHSLAFYYGQKLSIAECTIATIGLILIIILAAKLWGKLKQSRPSVARLGFSLLCAGVLLFFFIR
ncbi:MAG: hypothetical protein V1799_02645 [bacterium]